MSNKSVTTYILWAVYIALLAVLLPHTAWAFRQYEPVDSPVFLGGAFGSTFTWADAISYLVAFAFEAAIAVLTHKLSKRIEQTPKSKKAWQDKFAFRYLNGIAAGLVIATLVSGMANLAHAVEFGMSLKIFAEWGIPADFYSFAFGGILPLVSLTFANVLSNVVEDEEAPNPELTQANETIRSLRQQVRETEAKVKAAEQRANETERRAEELVKDAERRANLAEERFGALGDLVKYLFGEDKRQRIVFARRQWKELPNSAIAIIAGASPAYVSEVLKEEFAVELPTTTTLIEA